MIDLRTWVGNNPWLGATVWLLFLGFPIFSIWADDHGAPQTAVATAALVGFALIYAHGFGAVSHHEACGGRPHEWDRGWLYLAALVACIAGAFALTSAGVLSALPFVVSFAVFTRQWPEIGVIFAASVGVAVIVPWATGNALGGVLTGALVVCIGLAVMAIRIFEERTALERQHETEVAVITERERVGRDVHDVVGHNLTATIVKVELAQALLDGIDASTEAGAARLERARAELADLEAVSRRSLAEIRATVSGLRTADLDDELDSARTVLADAGVSLTVVGDRQHPQGATREALAWAVREGVTNVVRHARAESCQIEIAPTDGVALRIVDDGVGLSRNGSTPDGNGLAGLRSRLAAADLAIRIEEGDGGSGTILTVEETRP